MLVYQGSSLKAVRQTVVEIQTLESTQITYKCGKTQGTPSVSTFISVRFCTFRGLYIENHLSDSFNT
jgi:hypothetical protein